MALEQSILKSTKKKLGLAEDYNAFDEDVISHVNSVFSTLNQLGIGPPDGFMIEDNDAEWNEFSDSPRLINLVKTYVYLRVRMLFDPPGTSYHISAIKDEITELEYRLKYEREVTAWSPSSASLP